MIPVRFLAPAEEEMNASAQYYEQQLSGLGHRFLGEVAYAIDAIRAYPDTGSPFGSHYRRKLFRHFPYALVYRIEQSGIVIVAVMHQHRKPNYWKSR